MDSLPLHPQVFEEATKWRVQLQDGNERELAPFASGGTIAQTLAMLAEGLVRCKEACSHGVFRYSSLPLFPMKSPFRLPRSIIMYTTGV